MESPYRVGVIGSRTFKNYSLLEDILDRAPFSISKIISGGAVGADKLSIKYAKKKNIEWEEFLPDFKKYKHPYHHRNRLIAEASDIVIAFWDGRSTGTKYTINYAKTIGKRVEVVKF